MWLILESQDGHFTYQYSYELFDKEGDWQETVIKKAEDKDGVEQSLQKFFPRLEALLTQLNIQLKPAAGQKNSFHSLSSAEWAEFLLPCTNEFPLSALFIFAFFTFLFSPVNDQSG